MPAEPRRPDPRDALRGLHTAMERTANTTDNVWLGEQIEQWCIVLHEIRKDLDSQRSATPDDRQDQEGGSDDAR